MGGAQTKHLQQITKNGSEELKLLDQEVSESLNTWFKKAEARNPEMTKCDKQKQIATSTSIALGQVQKILSSVLDMTTPNYKIIANALCGTIKMLCESVSAHSKQKAGYYLTTGQGKGIIRIEYFFYFKEVEGKFLGLQKNQTLISYGYIVAPYVEPYTLQKLGSLVEGMDLNDKSKKEIIVPLTKFATDAHKMAEMKKYQQQAEDFW